MRQSINLFYIQNTCITTIFHCYTGPDHAWVCWWQWRRWVCAVVNMLPLTNPPPHSAHMRKLQWAHTRAQPRPAQPSPAHLLHPFGVRLKSIGMTTTAPQWPQLSQDMMNAMSPLELSTNLRVSPCQFLKATTRCTSRSEIDDARIITVSRLWESLITRQTMSYDLWFYYRVSMPV